MNLPLWVMAPVRSIAGTSVEDRGRRGIEATVQKKTNLSGIS
jgi:hypothetical protein